MDQDSLTWGHYTGVLHHPMDLCPISYSGALHHNTVICLLTTLAHHHHIMAQDHIILRWGLPWYLIAHLHILDQLHLWALFIIMDLIIMGIMDGSKITGFPEQYFYIHMYMRSSKIMRIFDTHVFDIRHCKLDFVIYVDFIWKREKI